jgi:predicted membrane protein
MNNLNREEIMKRHHNGRRLAGFIVVLAGAVWLGKKSGLEIPDWVFSWPVFLIVLGLFIGAKNRFRKPGWIILCLVGSVFLAERLVVGLSISNYLWPAVIIIAGLAMIFAPRRKKWNRECWPEHWEKEKWDGSEPYSSDDYIDSVSVFGGIKKNIISKDFKGGDIVNIFGGAEINLTQSEIKGRVVMEIVNVFGGAKLIVPPHWEISSEMVAILGGMEDKRMQQTNTTNGEDILVIRGTSIFGGIEIKSY